MFDESATVVPIKRIGDTWEGWTLLFPVVITIYGEDWLAIDQYRRTCLIAFPRSGPESPWLFEFIGDIQYYLKNSGQKLQDMRKHLPGDITEVEFAQLALLYGGKVYDNFKPNLAASWCHSHDDHSMNIFYGRLIERVNNGNNVVIIENRTILYKQNS